MNGPKRKFHPLRTEADMNTAARRCDCPGCDERGEYRAPKSRDALQDYYWFCLDHVREYNRSWDYFAGFRPDEIEAQIRGDITWQRPTWPLGQRGASSTRFAADRVRDAFDIFGDTPWTQSPPERNAHSPAEQAAMREMDLKAPLTVDEVKSRYKELCKLYHPDANGGDKVAEERFKQIGQAYKTLMESLNP